MGQEGEEETEKRERERGYFVFIVILFDFRFLFGELLACSSLLSLDEFGQEFGLVFLEFLLFFGSFENFVCLVSDFVIVGIREGEE